MGLIVLHKGTAVYVLLHLFLFLGGPMFERQRQRKRAREREGNERDEGDEREGDEKVGGEKEGDKSEGGRETREKNKEINMEIIPSRSDQPSIVTVY